jgi:hypothetical protein
MVTDAVFQMDRAQVRDFEEFFEDTIADGSLPFEWDHPLTGQTYLWQFDPDTVPQKSTVGNTVVRVTCRLLRLP